MPYSMNDYPDSLKNMEKLERKKAIDIINALLEEGYDDGRAIPIGTSQAEEWYADASKEELDELENKDVTEHEDDPGKQGGKIADNDVEVFFEDDEWKVQTKGAKRPSNTYDNKNDATKRAKEIAENRGAETIIHNKNE
ncbi:DUF2188 domain-containing protein [Salinicoccus sp. ID82-1]|uniref:DUF2188 domain-containing protein n=1 Tax=Salinicoccus cyprini TaxID=2493691 RepID=A0A558ATU5_9STAP|nr:MULTISPECIES: DUF2188 domain-containing protein [Salinicoccus]MCG1010834.1 DUF2188 domain-containing protein [Salinicoccus sp. ID82-1]TVT27687.1 DUF2188 domain-containing protein [Salinicoccus cyprini]